MLLTATISPQSLAQTTTAGPAETHLGRGYDALKQDRYEVAAQKFRAALALDPSLVLRAQFPLAVALFEQHKSSEARRELYRADDAERLTALGMIYGQDGDLDAALKPFLRAAELSPQSPQVQYNLALTYAQLSRFEDARAPLAQALKRWPDLFPLNALYGQVLSKLGDDTHSYETLRHARQLNPEDAATSELLYVTTLKVAESRVKGHAYH